MRPRPDIMKPRSRPEKVRPRLRPNDLASRPHSYWMVEQDKVNKDGLLHGLIRRALGLPGGFSGW